MWSTPQTPNGGGWVYFLWLPLLFSSNCHKYISYILQGSCDGQFGYFPSSYVMYLRHGERAVQVASGVEVTEVTSNVPVKLLKDQARNCRQCTLVHKYPFGLSSCCCRSSFKRASSPEKWSWSELEQISDCPALLATCLAYPYRLEQFVMMQFIHVYMFLNIHVNSASVQLNLS